MLKKISSTFNNFPLAKKQTVLLLIIFLAGMALSGTALGHTLNYKAQNEIGSKALLLMNTINAVSSYTAAQVTPQLKARLKPDEFLPQTIPFYVGQEVFKILQKQGEAYKDYYYKAAMLNPTNPQDKADIFETAMVTQFRQNTALREWRGYRSVRNKEFYYIARPLVITESSCLQCHGKPEAAPKGMIQKYGTKNGFGWKLNEIVGAQVVSVPASQVLQNARQSFVVVMGIVVIVFALSIFMANLWLKRHIVRPIKRIVQVAEAVSTGDMDAEFEKQSNDEVGSLVEAFTRMKVSLAMAITRIERYRVKSQKPNSDTTIL